jgi:hypothetical protein
MITIEVGKQIFTLGNSKNFSLSKNNLYIKLHSKLFSNYIYIISIIEKDHTLKCVGFTKDTSLRFGTDTIYTNDWDRCKIIGVDDEIL